MRIRVLLWSLGLRWCWGQVIGGHLDLPSIALTDFNRSKVAPDLSRATVLTFRRNRRTPFSVFPDGIAIGTYRMRGSWIVRGVMAEVMQYLEHVRIIFFDSRSTVILWPVTMYGAITTERVYQKYDRL